MYRDNFCRERQIIQGVETILVSREEFFVEFVPISFCPPKIILGIRDVTPFT